MSGKTKKIKRYSLGFKQELIRQLTNGEISRKDACSRYGLGHSSLERWLKEFGVNNVEHIELPLDMEKSQGPIPSLLSEQSPAEPLSEDVATLQDQIKDLQAKLEYMSLRAKAAELVIDIAERELGLEIKKKYNTKPSGR